MSNMRLPFPIVPAVPGEVSHYAKYGAGGLHYVGSVDSLDDISDEIKEVGMLVFVGETNDLYTWTGTDWVILEYVKKSLFESDLEDIKNLIDWGEYE